MNRKFRAARGRSLHVERLESRRVMAGNVLVQLIDGTLYIDGDHLSNGIAIVGTETPGEVEVRGTPAVAGDVTTLNDQTSPLRFVITNDIVIRMGAGDDGVELNSLTIPRNLTIETGDGLDRVSIGSVMSAEGRRTAPMISWPPSGRNVPGALILAPGHNTNPQQVIPPVYRPLSHTHGTVEIGRDLSIDTGAASDYVYIGYTNVTGNTTLLAGDGDDVLVIRSFNARNLDVAMERGNDLVNIAALRTRVQVQISTGFGNDFVSFANSHARGPARFLGGHGNNQIYIAGSVFSAVLYAEFGVDHDRLSIKHSMLLGNSTFVMGGGHDRIDIDYSFGRFVSADTGAGNDAISVVGSALDNIYAAMGSGDDHFSLVGSRILHPFVIHGGDGAGDVFHSYGSVATTLATPGFEHKTAGWPWWLTM